MNLRELFGNLGSRPESIKRVEKILNESKGIIWKISDLRVSNPNLFRIKCLPIIDKKGNKFREIIAATNSPRGKIA